MKCPSSPAGHACAVFLGTVLFLVFFAGTLFALGKGVVELNPRPTAAKLDLTDTVGRHYSTSHLAGKVVILNFWSTWCKPCRKEMPAMQKLWTSQRDRGVVLLAVAVGDSAEDVRVFQRKTGFDFPLIADEAKAVADEWSVIAVPTTFVLDKLGQVAFRVVGEYPWGDSQIAERIRRLTRE